jgi:hypothetical protein
MKPAVAERLQIRCGYSHPYSHGDARNPIVYVHRVERVAGERLHVLARIGDAGSDHTGRSNFLAHLIAVSDTETRRLTAGPADVARRFPFTHSWNEAAREAEPPTLVAADRGPAPCAAWRAAGLDPGIAGDLAEAAAAGSEVRLITRERDDVLALFADALALVPPAKRWQVTFNTCEIEPFDATWRAVREDLPQAANARSIQGVIDLTKSGKRGSEGGYARFARGEDVPLPWQTVDTPVADVGRAPTAGTTGIKPAPAGTTPAIRDASTASKASTATRQGPTPPPRVPGKRNLLEKVGATDVAAGDESNRKPSRLPMILLSSVIAIALIALGALAFLSQRPDAVARIAATFRDKTSEMPTPPKEANPAGQRATVEPDSSSEGEPEGDEDAAEKLEQLEKDQHDKARAEQEQEQEQEQDQELAKRRRIEEEDKQKKDKDAAEAVARDAEKKKEAFGQFQALPTTIPSDIPPSNSEPLPIRLGLLDAEHLDGLQFEIAVPKERLGTSDFKAWVEQPSKDKREWVVLTDKNIDDKTSRTLATLSVTEGNLWLTPEKLDPKLRALLRRSVLLATATDPDHNGKLVTRGVQLLVPKKTPAPFSTPLAGVHENKDTIPLHPPAGITVPPSGTNDPPKLPLNAAVVEYTIAFPYDRKGDKKKPVIHTNTLAVHGGSAYCALLEKLLPPDPATTIGVVVELSQQDGVMSIRTKADGPGASAVDFKRLVEAAEHTDKSYEKSKNNIIHAVKQFVAQLTKSTPVDYENKSQAALTKLSTLGKAQHFAEFEGTFGSFFVREKLFTKQVPDPKQPGTGKTVPEVVTNPDECCRLWHETCKQIASGDPNPDPKKDIAEWNREFVDVIKRWASDWEPRFEEYADTLRRYAKPLNDEVTITVTRITSTAYAADGTEYIVVLSTPNGQGRQDDSRTDVD